MNNLPAYVPSSAFTASSASRESSNWTNANPGGFLATQTFFNGPYFENANLKIKQLKLRMNHKYDLTIPDSTSDLIASSLKLPT